MKFGRILLALVAVAAVVGLVVWFPGSSEPEPSALDRPVVAAAVADQAVSATWYCAAATAGPGEPFAHRIIITNPTDRNLPVRVSPVGPTGPVPSKMFLVPAHGPFVVDVDREFAAPGLSASVESPSGQIVVEHRLTAINQEDQVPCATATSDRWWFPALDSARGATAKVTLFNPFPGDAGVDIEVILDASARTPAELSGIVVPARSSRVVDLGAVVQRRDLFAVVVRARSGRLIAETTQTFDGSTGVVGLRMNVGMATESPRWVLPGGFTGQGVAESLVVVNPTDQRISAEVRVIPFAGASTAPEPIVLDLPALRYAVVDLSAESRVPPVGYHAISVATDGAPVVVARLNSVTGPPAAAPAPADGAPATAVRPAVTSGVAISTGSPVMAGDWLVPAIDAGANPAPVVFVHNPSSTAAQISTVPVDPDLGADAVAAATSTIEVAAGDSVALTVPPSTRPGTSVGLRITSMTPIVVERLVTYPTENELAMGLAVPFRTPQSGPVPLPGR
ncbi:MAG: DUF5719 family protein [Microthrixaceae bacterium]